MKSERRERKEERGELPTDVIPMRPQAEEESISASVIDFSCLCYATAGKPPKRSDGGQALASLLRNDIKGCALRTVASPAYANASAGKPAIAKRRRVIPMKPQAEEESILCEYNRFLSRFAPSK